ncbi:hypothetical protein DY000_02026126 [Brassica cretica]|uniref:Uncharacterized protein n=1 Tax=Brassica cretica TaxID=69181 RepID=A0ABQ7E9J8_BRACR|nr:hypothetical protein DY000_02026126 [Brassica cretica]
MTGFRLREPEGRLGTGLETTFLGPGGLPGSGEPSTSSTLGSVETGSSLEAMGILSLEFDPGVLCLC